MNATTPNELQLFSQMHPFHPLVPVYYPTLYPTDLITFQTENKSDLSNLGRLLGNFLFVCFFFFFFNFRFFIKSRFNKLRLKWKRS
jgi:hypothetical protein